MWIKATNAYDATKICVNVDYLASLYVAFMNEKKCFCLQACETGQPMGYNSHKLGMFNTRKKAEEELNKIMDCLAENKNFHEVQNNMEIKRGCENCGNRRCAESPVALYWNECVESNFTKHWSLKEEKKDD